MPSLLAHTSGRGLVSPGPQETAVHPAHTTSNGKPLEAPQCENHRQLYGHCQCGCHRGVWTGVLRQGPPMPCMHETLPRPKRPLRGFLTQGCAKTAKQCIGCRQIGCCCCCCVVGHFVGTFFVRETMHMIPLRVFIAPQNRQTLHKYVTLTLNPPRPVGN